MLGGSKEGSVKETRYIQLNHLLIIITCGGGIYKNHHLRAKREHLHVQGNRTHRLVHPRNMVQGLNTHPSLDLGHLCEVEPLFCHHRGFFSGGGYSCGVVVCALPWTQMMIEDYQYLDLPKADVLFDGVHVYQFSYLSSYSLSSMIYLALQSLSPKQPSFHPFQLVLLPVHGFSHLTPFLCWQLKHQLLASFPSYPPNWTLEFQSLR
mmetsp:Transcript_14891/g.25096  ORF Transcript_14891/g.25096 Transcript_14891/m.25096 type:complete len:207 (-) Transcript_14891:569-1189(-)